MLVSDINFLELFPIDQFERGVKTLFAKKELAAAVAIRILLSVTVDQRVFISDDVLNFQDSYDISEKLQSTLEKVNDIVPFTTEKRAYYLPSVGLTKMIDFKCDLFFKDNLGKFTWGTTNITAEFPNGFSGGAPRIEVISATSDELFKKYTAVKKCLEQAVIPLFDDNNEFSVKPEQFYEVKIQN